MLFWRHLHLTNTETLPSADLFINPQSLSTQTLRHFPLQTCSSILSHCLHKHWDTSLCRPVHQSSVTVYTNTETLPSADLFINPQSLSTQTLRHFPLQTCSSILSHCLHKHWDTSLCRPVHQSSVTVYTNTETLPSADLFINPQSLSTQTLRHFPLQTCSSILSHCLHKHWDTSLCRPVHQSSVTVYTNTETLPSADLFIYPQSLSTQTLRHFPLQTCSSILSHCLHKHWDTSLCRPVHQSSVTVYTNTETLPSADLFINPQSLSTQTLRHFPLQTCSSILSHCLHKHWDTSLCRPVHLSSVTVYTNTETLPSADLFINPQSLSTQTLRHFPLQTCSSILSHCLHKHWDTSLCRPVHQSSVTVYTNTETLPSADLFIYNYPQSLSTQTLRHFPLQTCSSILSHCLHKHWDTSLCRPVHQSSVTVYTTFG